DLVAKYLEAEGFEVHAVHSGVEGKTAALEGSYELIVLDVMLPDKKGFEVLKEIRAHGRSPVLMLTAKGDEFDRVLGLELGADDYLSKPFSPRELVARIGAILRRSGWQSEGSNALRPPVIRSGDLELIHPLAPPQEQARFCISPRRSMTFCVFLSDHPDRCSLGRSWSRMCSIENFLRSTGVSTFTSVT